MDVVAVYNVDATANLNAYYKLQSDGPNMRATSF